MSLTTLCGLFGKTRQSYYVHQNEVTQAALNEEMIVKWVIQQREEIGRVGGKKLFHKFQLSAEMEGIKMGRDAFLTLLQVHDLVLRSKRKYTITTHSRHWLRKYPDLIKGLIVNSPEQLWVSDITYLRTQNGFCYLSLITDAYSRKIVGYQLGQTLEAKHCIAALEKALTQRCYPQRTLIHHSDRGVQYCCAGYVELLQHIQISMTQDGSPYDNAIAERINGILKQQFILDRTFDNYAQIEQVLPQYIQAYNQLTPHGSCDYLTPEQAHQRQGLLKKRG